jgi:hypothetical protein
MSEPLDVPAVQRLVRTVAPARVGEAATLPLPLLDGDRRALVVLLFGQPALAHKEILYAPHQRVVVDLERAQITADAPCSPADLGVGDPPRRRFTSFGLDGVSDELFWRGRADAERLSPAVWDDFFAQRDDAPSRARRADLRSAIAASTYAPLVPYLRGAAPAFFAWLEAEG